MKNLDYLLDLSKAHARVFAEQRPEREAYKRKHPTRKKVYKCADGRLNGALYTRTPMGILEPVRNLGGFFRLGWPALHGDLLQWYFDARKRGQRSLVFVTYHKSRGARHRGCAFFDGDDARAIASARSFKEQFDRALVSEFGRDQLCVLLMGFETDNEALVLHNERGEQVDLYADVVRHGSGHSFVKDLPRFFAGEHEQIINDLTPLVEGNLNHIQSVMQQSNRDLDVDADHHEFAFLVGRGFGWLHEANTAFILGAFDITMRPRLAKVVELARKNLFEGKTDGKLVHMACAPYYEPSGYHPAIAREKAWDLHNATMDVVKETAGDILPFLDTAVAVVDMQTQQLDILDTHRATEVFEYKPAKGDNGPTVAQTEHRHIDNRPVP